MALKYIKMRVFDLLERFLLPDFFCEKLIYDRIFQVQLNVGNCVSLPRLEQKMEKKFLEMNFNFFVNESVLRNFETKMVLKSGNNRVRMRVNRILNEKDYYLKSVSKCEHRGIVRYRIFSRLSQNFLGLWPKAPSVLSIFQNALDFSAFLRESVAAVSCFSKIFEELPVAEILPEEVRNIFSNIFFSKNVRNDVLKK